MAFSFFGKKDKNPPEAAAPVAKAPPAPPKIQTPPAAATVPTVKPPQPSGLIPTSGMAAGAATTQPMVMPRTAGGLKPTRPGVVQSTRSTQRIVLPGGAPGKPAGTKSLSMAATPPPAGRINLPMGMILRCLPAEVLAGDIAQFEAAGTAATEIGLPMNMILSQLPSGKVEISLGDLIPHFPPGFLQPTASITNYLPTMINLPLMDVVMRIPPDLLALRPDQKGVDASVINMADPFTEEILREQAEAARRQQAQANIIDESQVRPTEEFVPQEQASLAKTIAPPPRPTMPGMSTSASGQLPMPAAPAARLPGSVVPSAPSISARTISPSGGMAAPTRATTAIPARPQGSITGQLQGSLPPQPAKPIPTAAPIPRQTASMPAAPVPPVPRQTTSLPMPLPPAQPSLPPAAAVAPSVPAPAAPAPVEAPQPPLAPNVPDAAADDLQRLAALAMAQMGEGDEPSDATAALPENTPTVPVHEPLRPPEPEATVPIPTAPPAPVAFTPPPPAPVAAAPAPVPAPVPAPLPVAPAPIAAPAPMAPVPAAPKPVPAAFTPPAPVPAPVAPTPVPAPTPAVAAPVAAAPTPQPAQASHEQEPEGFNLNTCTIEDLLQIPGCYRDLAESIIRYRGTIGSYQKVEDLLDVPGMSKEAYVSLTGEEPPPNRIPLTLNELLGFPADQHASLKDVTERICCWPDIVGCVLSQGSGLSLVGQTPKGLDKAALVAFVPKMFESLNKSFSEVSGKETNDLIIPTPGISFHILRNNDLYLIILSRLPQMPDRHLKVARFVLSALSIRKD